ncbi:YedE family putative selenium transporter [Desulfosporosinus sp. FKA]|uniref:YedE family putative selenium transporter n=1 Tax=Desulfosporosinus sp. FKA TaxID=1969834 RepID=UPI000B498C10|nr:YedE family putative selenium transporter [Desulfosporosinus sp. FKA]
MDSKKGIIFTGAVIGILAVVLVRFGNPVNMGICIACFIRDTTGALGLHRAAVVQYIRPEIIGIVLGAFLISLGKKEFAVRGGSSPFIRFILGFVVMIGALMFLGCPLRMVLRLGGGDLNALFGLAGFAAGIIVGIIFLKNGFSLKRTYKLSPLEGFLFPLLNVGLFILLLTAPAFIFFSTKGPGAGHAPVWIALAAGVIVGVLVQRTRLCMVGGIRDAILFKDTYLILGFISILVFASLGNLYFGFYKLSFAAQSVAHTDGLWNFLGMALAGWGSVLLGGCPLRQLILASEGNIDSVITVLGMSAGAAFAHNFSLAASAQGPSPNGKIAVLIGFVLLLVIASFNLERETKATVQGGVKIGAS